KLTMTAPKAARQRLAIGSEAMVLIKSRACNTCFSIAGLKNGKRDLKRGGVVLLGVIVVCHIGTLAAGARVQYRRPRIGKCTNLLWTDLGRWPPHRRACRAGCGSGKDRPP